MTAVAAGGGCPTADGDKRSHALQAICLNHNHHHSFRSKETEIHRFKTINELRQLYEKKSG